MRWLSRVVSWIVIVAVVAAAALLLRAKMPNSNVGQRFATFAQFRDGSRLATGSPVMIAGVRVGEVTRLTVEGSFARVDMRLRDDTMIPADSWITKRAESAFGDSYIEIIPSGGAEAGAPVERRLQSGERLVHVIEGGSTDTVLRSIGRALPKVDRGLDTLHDVAIAGRHWSSGALEDRIADAERWLAEGHIEGPITRADAAMARAEAATASAALAVAKAQPDVDRALTRFDRGITGARAQMADFQTDLHTGLARARGGLDDLDPTLRQMSDVIAAVDEGRGDDWKGKLGRLVNDPALAETIEDATDSVRESVGNYNRFKSFLGLRLEGNLFSLAPRFYFTAEIHARTDKFYLVEIEKGPLGSVQRDELTDAAGVPTYSRHQEIRDNIRFTAQFGKTFGQHLQLRGGIKDSTFGFGVDMLMNEGRLRLSTDVFGSFTPTPRIKVAGALQVFRSVYLLAGIDDILGTPGYLPIRHGNVDIPAHFEKIRYGRDYFLGATLHFTDEDLSTMIRVYGALLVGLL